MLDFQFLERGGGSVIFYVKDMHEVFYKGTVYDTRFIALFYVKNEVSTETIFIFIFYFATVSREN